VQGRSWKWSSTQVEQGTHEALALYCGAEKNVPFEQFLPYELSENVLEIRHNNIVDVLNTKTSLDIVLNAKI
jgi:hypothetical protein